MARRKRRSLEELISEDQERLDRAEKLEAEVASKRDTRKRFLGSPEEIRRREDELAREQSYRIIQDYWLPLPVWCGCKNHYAPLCYRHLAECIYVKPGGGKRWRDFLSSYPPRGVRTRKPLKDLTPRSRTLSEFRALRLRTEPLSPEQVFCSIMGSGTWASFLDDKSERGEIPGAVKPKDSSPDFHIWATKDHIWRTPRKLLLRYAAEPGMVAEELDVLTAKAKLAWRRNSPGSEREFRVLEEEAETTRKRDALYSAQTDFVESPPDDPVSGDDGLVHSGGAERYHFEPEGEEE